ncbi:hypothetical protein DL93DRAFT_2157857 [Clavulina sp. PMI_390]|nr:hypothetical protein DL93DRAFT_2157857 [Clavulina sp. PMI_390]
MFPTLRAEVKPTSYQPLSLTFPTTALEMTNEPLLLGAVEDALEAHRRGRKRCRYSILYLPVTSNEHTTPHPAPTTYQQPLPRLRPPLAPPQTTPSMPFGVAAALYFISGNHNNIQRLRPRDDLERMLQAPTIKSTATAALPAPYCTTTATHVMPSGIAVLLCLFSIDHVNVWRPTTHDCLEQAQDASAAYSTTISPPFAIFSTSLTMHATPSGAAAPLSALCTVNDHHQHTRYPTASNDCPTSLLLN